MYPTIYKKIRGFTLIELLITVVIAAILVALAVPAMQSFVQNNRITAQLNELTTALVFTRSEAIKRKQVITICSSSNSTLCGGNWNEGWIIFRDIDNDGVLDAGTDEEPPLRAREGLSGGTTLVETSSKTSLRFDQVGSVNTTANFEMRIPGCRGDQGRDIMLLITGQPDVSRKDC